MTKNRNRNNRSTTENNVAESRASARDQRPATMVAGQESVRLASTTTENQMPSTVRRNNQQTNAGRTTVSSSASVNRQSESLRVSSGPERRANKKNKILSVHGLQHFSSLNCDNVFNLFCIYGNVVKIKILKNNQVLVELDNVDSAEQCIANLQSLPLDASHKLEIKYFEHPTINDNAANFKLQDGTPAIKYYSTCRLNRFPANDIAPDKRRPIVVAAPSKILHFFNAPKDVCGAMIHKTVSDAIGRTDVIRSIIILPNKPGANSSNGLIEMNSVDMATKAIFLLNHMPLKSTKSRFPFFTKLCFSKWSEAKPKPGNSRVVLFCSTASRSPLPLHGSKLAVSSTEFPVSCMTRVVSGDHVWSLFHLDGRTAATAAGPVAKANNPARPVEKSRAVTVEKPRAVPVEKQPLALPVEKPLTVPVAAVALRCELAGAPNKPLVLQPNDSNSCRNDNERGDGRQ